MLTRKNVLHVAIVFLLFFVSGCKKPDGPAPAVATGVREMNAQEKALSGHWNLYETRDTSWGYANGSLISMNVDSAKNFDESHFLLLAAENAKEDVLKKYPASLHCIHAIEGTALQTGWTADPYSNLFIDGQRTTVISKGAHQLVLRYEVYNLTYGNGHKIFFYYYFRS